MCFLTRRETPHKGSVSQHVFVGMFAGALVVKDVVTNYGL